MQGDLYRAQDVTLPVHGTDILTFPPKDREVVHFDFRTIYKSYSIIFLK